MSVEGAGGLLVLVLVSMAVGWLLAYWQRWRHRSNNRRESNAFPRVEYFKGLNFLLNEQPDKAIEVFMDMVEVDSDTVDTHFALASLFRRRGEVDRAIRLHQNLIARPNLTRRVRSYALRELGEDYMRAGLLDRAESLFLELVDVRPHVETALRHLVAIYEQQKDWDQAIRMRRKLEAASGADQSAIIAYYLCELAIERRKEGDKRGAQKLLKRANAYDGNNTRTSMMLGDLALEMGYPKQALRHLRHALDRDSVFASEILPWVARAYRDIGTGNDFDGFIEAMTKNDVRAESDVAIATLLHTELSTAATERCIDDYVSALPILQSLREMIGSIIDQDVANKLYGSDTEPLRPLLTRLLTHGTGYRCNQCGYTGKTLYWQCPGCRTWGSAKPFHDLSLTAQHEVAPVASQPSARFDGLH